jgi:hypothetical protein
MKEIAVVLLVLVVVGGAVAIGLTLIGQRSPSLPNLSPLWESTPIVRSLDKSYYGATILHRTVVQGHSTVTDLTIRKTDSTICVIRVPNSLADLYKENDHIY